VLIQVPGPCGQTERYEASVKHASGWLDSEDGWGPLCKLHHCAAQPQQACGVLCPS
jgi:hypothetical protein